VVDDPLGFAAGSGGPDVDGTITDGEVCLTAVVCKLALKTHTMMEHAMSFYLVRAWVRGVAN